MRASILALLLAAAALACGDGQRATLHPCPSSISVRLDIAALFASSEASGKKPSNSGQTDIEDGLGHSVTTDDGLPSPPVAKLSSTTTPSAATRT